MLGTALTWAAGWGLAGGVLHGLFTAMGYGGFLTASFGVELLLHALMGFLGGATFSVGLLATERRRTLSTLRLSRSAAWGALAGLVGPLLVFLEGHYSLPLPTLHTVWPPTLWPLFLGTTVFGAISGGGMAAIARGAAPDALEASDDGLLLGAPSADSGSQQLRSQAAGQAPD